jgi:hypothetical protein
MGRRKKCGKPPGVGLLERITPMYQWGQVEKIPKNPGIQMQKKMKITLSGHAIQATDRPIILILIDIDKNFFFCSGSIEKFALCGKKMTISTLILPLRRTGAMSRERDSM